MEGQTEGDRRIDVSTADTAHRIYGQGDGQTPAGSDDDPTRVLAFGPIQQNVGHHSITQDEKDHRPNCFREIDSHFSSQAR